MMMTNRKRSSYGRPRRSRLTPGALLAPSTWGAANKKLTTLHADREAIITSSSSARGTPKRAAATRASGRLAIPKHVSSDEEEESASEEVSSVGSDLRRAQEGGSDESEEEEDATMDDDFDEEEEGEEDEPVKVKKGKGKAVARAKPTKASGKRKRAATSDEDAEAAEESELIIEDDLAENSDDEAAHIRSAIAASLGRATSGGTKSKRAFKLVVSKFKAGGKGEAAAGKKQTRKGKERKVSDDEDDEAADSSFTSPVLSAQSSDLSDLSPAASEAEEDSDAEEAAPARRRRARGTGGGRKPKKTWWQKNQEALEKHHAELRDVWGDLKANVSVLEPEKAVQPEGLSLRLLPFQLEGLDWMVKQEKGPWKGGMLADEMGMGKTVQTISLILSDRQGNDGKQTLVIAPTVAIMQASRCVLYTRAPG